MIRKNEFERIFNKGVRDKQQKEQEKLNPAPSFEKVYAKLQELKKKKK